MKTRRFRRKGKFFVYIVACADGTYYTGFTPCLARRIRIHNKGKGAKYTRDRRPVRLVWHKRYRNFKPAFLEEKRIKALSRRQKEALVGGAPSGVVRRKGRRLVRHAKKGQR
jgi:putative endonuclease